MTDFSAKRPGETELFTVDFVNLISVGAVISSATWTNSVKTGTDASPGAMISGSAIINGTQVSTRLMGGVSGVVYAPICTAVTQIAGQPDEILILPEPTNGALPIT